MDRVRAEERFAPTVPHRVPLPICILISGVVLSVIRVSFTSTT